MNKEMAKTFSKKICLLGDSSVGKTSITRRFVDSQFSDDYKSTLGVKISKKVVTDKNRINHILMIWDLEGSQNLESFPQSYIRSCFGGIFVVDITKPKMWNNIINYLHFFKKINPHSKTVLAFNKSDLLLNSALDSEKNKELFQHFNNHLITSAKESSGVDDLFKEFTI